MEHIVCFMPIFSIFLTGIVHFCLLGLFLVSNLFSVQLSNKLTKKMIYHWRMRAGRCCCPPSSGVWYCSAQSQVQYFIAIYPFVLIKSCHLLFTSSSSATKPVALEPRHKFVASRICYGSPSSNPAPLTGTSNRLSVCRKVVQNLSYRPRRCRTCDMSYRCLLDLIILVMKCC